MDLLQYKPKAQFAQRHLLTLQDYTPDEILQVLSLAAKLKLQRKLGMDQTHILRGKNVALIFTKPSMRTRVSFEVASSSSAGTRSTSAGRRSAWARASPSTTWPTCSAALSTAS